MCTLTSTVSPNATSKRHSVPPDISQTVDDFSSTGIEFNCRPGKDMILDYMCGSGVGWSTSIRYLIHGLEQRIIINVV